MQNKSNNKLQLPNGAVIPSDFGHWLAGFIAGEGCFKIWQNKNTESYTCRFKLKLRDDDKDILTEIVTLTRIGSVQPERNGRGDNPSAVWVVENKEHCQNLVAMLDCYPLRAKKLRDYLVWRDAVQFWITAPRGTVATGPRHRAKWAEMSARLKACRLYCAADENIVR